MKEFDIFSKVDKTAFSVGTLNHDIDDRDFWLSKSPEERLRAIELIRQTIYGYSFTTARLQRVFEIIELTAP
ncbi:MAG: hypothetical protein M1381_09280 [Deltaproteobacteria bacterium]|nr:hypothetical protein [Deltaproteobacteria bacterium]